MFDDFVIHRKPPANRVRYSVNGVEHYFPEGAVMVAFAPHLLRTVRQLNQVTIHPDGEHGKQFPFRRWLEQHSFTMIESMGTTSYGGTYSSARGQKLIVNPKSGQGDVFAEGDGFIYVAECKGGVLNTKHPGQQSRLRQGLCETVGLLLASPITTGRRQFAVVPRTNATANLAEKLAGRAHPAGIEIALVDAQGNVFEVTPKR